MTSKDTTIRISREAKDSLERARQVWEQRTGQRIGAGDFVGVLSERYLSESGREPSGTAEPVGLVGAQAVRPFRALDVHQGPQVTLVQCARCSGQIAWRLDLGPRGFCPYCGALLQLSG